MVQKTPSSFLIPHLQRNRTNSSNSQPRAGRAGTTSHVFPLLSRTVDPDALNPDTYGSGSSFSRESGYGSGSRVLMTNTEEKNTAEIFFISFRSTIAIYLSLGLHERTSKLQEKPSALKREHPALQKMKFINFFFYVCGSFLPSWIRIRTEGPYWIRTNPDPDPDP
jgi:hypothetical protein